MECGGGVRVWSEVWRWDGVWRVWSGGGSSQTRVLLVPMVLKMR